MPDDDPRRPKPGHPTPRSVPTPRSMPVMPATDQDQPRKALAHTTKRRTDPKGYPVVEPETRLTFDADRDRRRSDSAGSALPAPRRATSQYESWEEMHTPPTADPETWRAVRQIGIDLKELSDDIAEQRTAFTNLITNTLNQLLEQKSLVMTADVRVKETSALTTISDRSEHEKLKREIMRKWLVGTLAAAFTLVVGALIHKYL